MNFHLGGITISGYFGQYEYPIHGNFRSRCLRNRSSGQGRWHRRRRRSPGKDCYGHPLRCLQRLRRLTKKGFKTIDYTCYANSRECYGGFIQKSTRALQEDKKLKTHTFFSLLATEKKIPFFARPQAPSHNYKIKQSIFFSLFSALYTFKFIRWNYVCANLRIIFCPPNSSKKNPTHPEIKRKWPPFCSLYFLFSSRYYRLPIQLLCRWLKNKRIQKLNCSSKDYMRFFQKIPEICFATAEL